MDGQGQPSGRRRSAQVARPLAMPLMGVPNGQHLPGSQPRNPGATARDFNHPEHPFPARTPIAPWQRSFAIILVGLVVGAACIDYRLPIAVIVTVLSVSFLLVVLLRLLALLELFRRRAAWPMMDERLIQRHRAPDDALPVYSIIVALYDEAAVVADLIEALAAIDYPPTKLDIIFVLEPDDHTTARALAGEQVPFAHRVVLADTRGPRTKPKALNCALPLIVGDYIVVYDAEDRPEPDQLRKVLACFRAARSAAIAGVAPHWPRLVCVQAELNVYNARESWFTRQFTIEYTTLFGAILPALARRGWPVPLGGTSNHFDATALIALGGWDPYNVTEDADLGIRIARAGWATAMVRSTTWEEAPVTFGDWYRQRTRWIKGWIVTILVHTRAPGQLVRDLGLMRTSALLLVMGGTLLSAFCNPLALAGLAFWLGREIVGGEPAAALEPDGGLMKIVLWLAVGNFIVGYALAIVTAAIATARRHGFLALRAVSLPVFWLFITAAAFRALWQLRKSVHVWEKTPHGGRRRVTAFKHK